MNRASNFSAVGVKTKLYYELWAARPKNLLQQTWTLIISNQD